MTTQKRKGDKKMKRLGMIIALVMSVATLSKATQVTVDYTNGGQYPNGVGNPCTGTTCGTLVQGSGGQVTFTPEPMSQIVQTVINNNNITVPANIGLQSTDSGSVGPVGGLNFTNTGVAVTNSGSVDLSGLQTSQSIQNTTDISNLNTNLATTNNNVTNLGNTVTNLGNTVTNNSTDISGLQTTVANHTTQINQNTSDISSLQTNVTQNTSDIGSLAGGLGNERTERIAGDNALGSAIGAETSRATSAESSINNMSDPSTVLNQTVNGNTAAIANETTRATGVETVLNQSITNETGRAETAESNEAATRASADNVLQNNINSESSARASGDQALQNQINNLNSQAADNENRIDRLEQTKYLLEPIVRLYDSKRWQVQAFDSYDVRHGMNSAIGARVMFKLGKSYEEKLIERTNPEIARLLASNVQKDDSRVAALEKQLSEDRQLITEQAAALKAVQDRFAGLKAVDINLAASSGNDEDLLNALEKHAEGK